MRCCEIIEFDEVIEHQTTIDSRTQSQSHKNEIILTTKNAK
jgi:hypothetical protein